MLRKPILQEEDMLYTVAAAEAGLMYTEEVMHVIILLECTLMVVLFFLRAVQLVVLTRSLRDYFQVFLTCETILWDDLLTDELHRENTQCAAWRLVALDFAV